VRDSKLCPVKHNQYRGCSRGQTSPFSRRMLRKIVYTPQRLCRGEASKKVCATEVRVCNYLINLIQVTAADIISGQILFVRSSI
jgi:hypothetical protein